MNLLAPLRPVADVMDLAGEAVAALGIVTVTTASRCLPPTDPSDDTGDRPTLRIVAAGSGRLRSTGTGPGAPTRDRSDQQ